MYGRFYTGALIAFLASPANAHHSFARFDYDKQLTLSGTVKEFQFTNPHSWIKLMVPGASNPVEWAIECSSVNNMVRTGWKKTTLAAGDMVTVTFRPTRDGTKEGSLVGISEINGKTATLGDGRLPETPTQ